MTDAHQPPHADDERLLRELQAELQADYQRSMRKLRRFLWLGFGFSVVLMVLGTSLIYLGPPTSFWSGCFDLAIGAFCLGLNTRSLRRHYALLRENERQMRASFAET